MKRKEVSQFITTKWFPKLLKQLIAEFLNWFVQTVRATKPFVSVIEKGLSSSKKREIINIDFKIGAGIETVKPFLKNDIRVSSVPISQFNTSKNGLYLFVNSFHQLPPEKAKQILEKIVLSKNPLVIVEGNNDSLWQIVGMTIFVPLSVLLTACFVRPFRWSRLLFTYLIPILPIIIMIDGCLALFKLYNPKDLKELVNSLDVQSYKWEASKNDNGRGGKIMYLIGQPKIEIAI